MPALMVNVPDGLELGRQVVAAEAPKPRRKRRMKTKAEWAKFVTKKHGPAAVTEALKKASASRKVMSASEKARRAWVEASSKADRHEVQDLDLKMDKIAGTLVSMREVDRGTPECRRNVTRDAFMVMYEEGRIDQEAYDAGILIAKGWQMETLGLDAQIATYGHRIPGGMGNVSDYATVILLQYKQWRQAYTAREDARIPGYRGRFNGVMAVIRDGWSCKAAEKAHGIGVARLFPHLLDALELYNAIRFGRGQWRAKKAA